LVAPIQSNSAGSNGSRPGRGSAVWSIATGLLSLASLPLAVAVTRWRGYELIDAAVAVPAAALLGALSIWLARRSRRRLQRAVLATSRGRTARVGRVLGLTGFLIASTAALAVGVSLVLEAVAD
jgi:hypothetical protein